MEAAVFWAPCYTLRNTYTPSTDAAGIKKRRQVATNDLFFHPEDISRNLVIFASRNNRVS